MFWALIKRAWALWLGIMGTLAILTSCAVTPSAAPAGAQKQDDPLLAAFAQPPHAARPQLWWHWMNGNVTQKGALLDLEWMNRMGIGGVHLFSGALFEPIVVDEPAPFMSKAWSDAFAAAVTRARSYGMEVTIAGSPGWSQTGGPWVAPQDGMKKFVWSETVVKGGRPAGRLAPLPVATGPFQALTPSQGLFGAPVTKGVPHASGDSAVVAFRTEAGAMPAPSFMTSDGALPELAALLPDLSKSVRLPVPADGGFAFIDVMYDDPVEIRSLTIGLDVWPGFEVLARTPAGGFTTVRSVGPERAEHPSPQQTYTLPTTRSRHFRIRFNPPQAPRRLPNLPAVIPVVPAPDIIGVKYLSLSREVRVQRFESKAGFEPAADFDADRTEIDSQVGVVDPQSVVDLTGRLGEDGLLDWIPPDGDWIIIRIGWSLTGKENGPAEPEATGLEVDKLDPDAVERYIAELFALYETNTGIPVGPDGISGLLTDSWEAGVQNWTPMMLEEFERRRGYRAQPWLPVLTGRIVASAEASDAFLFDFRRTLGEMLVDHHYARLADIAAAKGIVYYSEAQGDTPRAILDGYAAKANAAIPTAEFWYRPFATAPGQPSLIADILEAASVAHVYGKPFVAVEALTVAAGNDPWSFSPAMLKPVADRIFASGANRILIHESHTQPFEDKAPGLMLGIFGQFFNRLDTWADYARPWTDYLARTSFLLQQGDFVADIAVFYGEERSLTQRHYARYEPPVPRGYGFDFVNASAIREVLAVRGGRLTAASGMQYRVLYIPPDVRRITPETLEALDRLVRDGAVLVANKPDGISGLQINDNAARDVIARLWGEGGRQIRNVGKGRVHTHADLAGALAAEEIVPDVVAPPETDLLTLHRRLPGHEIYYFSNQGGDHVLAPVSFRAAGRAMLWDAASGRSRPLTYRQDGQYTEVLLPLEPDGAGFVVFTPSPQQHVTVREAELVTEQVVEGPWTVTFQPGRGAPARATFEALSDWSAHADAGIRYFSGGATYSRELFVEPEMLASGTDLFLDLGDVREIAVVSVDGQELGIAWKAPYRINLTAQVTPGRRRLEVKVVNLWTNRLIGDRQPGAEAVAFAPQAYYTAQSPLKPSGLLGPVRLVQETRASVH